MRANIIKMDEKIIDINIGPDIIGDVRWIS